MGVCLWDLENWSPLGECAWEGCQLNLWVLICSVTYTLWAWTVCRPIASFKKKLWPYLAFLSRSPTLLRLPSWYTTITSIFLVCHPFQNRVCWPPLRSSVLFPFSSSVSKAFFYSLHKHHKMIYLIRQHYSDERQVDLYIWIGNQQRLLKQT